MILGFYVIILVNVLVNIFGTWAEILPDNSVLSDHQANRLCHKTSQMKSLDRSDDEVEKFLRDELVQIMKQKALSDKGHILSDDYDHNQLVDITSKNEVGASGHLYQVQLIGTDASTGTYSTATIQEHLNNYFDSADVSDLLIFLSARTDLRNSFTNRPENRNTKVSKSSKRSGEKHSSMKECKEMLKAVYDLISQDPILKKVNQTIQSTKSKEKVAEHLLHRSKYHDERNSTHFDTQMSLGPNSAAGYIVHEARGEASNTATASDGELQVHGTYKNSVVSLKTISLSSAVTS